MGRNGGDSGNIHHYDTNNEEDRLLGLPQTLLRKGTWLYFLSPWNFVLTLLFLFF